MSVWGMAGLAVFYLAAISALTWVALSAAIEAKSDRERAEHYLCLWQAKRDLLTREERRKAGPR